MPELSNAEFMLLQILQQEGSLSGYGINNLVEERHYRPWADVGMTSIYVSLKKLQQKGLVDSSVDTQKTGKGPLPKLFTLLANGLTALRQETESTLASPESRGARLSLALSASNVLAPKKLLACLQQRQQGLQWILKTVREERYEAKGGAQLPTPAQWLFRHSFALLETEIQFAHQLIDELQTESRNGKN